MGGVITSCSKDLLWSQIRTVQSLFNGDGIGINPYLVFGDRMEARYDGVFSYI